MRHLQKRTHARTHARAPGDAREYVNKATNQPRNVFCDELGLPSARVRHSHMTTRTRPGAQNQVRANIPDLIPGAVVKTLRDNNPLIKERDIPQRRARVWKLVGTAVRAVFAIFTTHFLKARQGPARTAVSRNAKSRECSRPQ